MIFRICIGLLLLLAPLSALADTVRVGIFVGNDIGFGQDETLSHAEREAREMSRVFQEMGDIPRERAFLVTGAKAPEVRDTLYRVEAQVRELSVQGHDVQVLFYYSGHASRDGLHLSGTLLPMPAVRSWLENSSARVRVAFLDACESGTLARSKGGTPTEVVDLSVDDQITSRGLAIVTSTGPLSVARESDAYGGGIFSRALLTGLRGSADINADGRITLEEAYQHAFENTVARSVSGTSGVQTPEYRFDLEGVGDVVLTRIPSRAAGLILPTELEGTYTIVSVSSGQVVGRVEKKPGKERRVALPPGRYVVRKVRREDVLLSEVDLAWGGDRLLDDRQMTSVELGDPLTRGGWSTRPVRVSVRGTGATRYLAGNPGSTGGELATRVRISPRLRFDGVVGHASGERDEWEGWLHLQTTRVAAGVSAQWPRDRLDFSVGGGLQGIRTRQYVEYLEAPESDEPIERALVDIQQVLPGAYLQADVHLPVGPRAGIEVGTRANVMIGLVDDVRQPMVELQGFAGLTVGLGGRKVSRAKQR
jgi:hypothetical protein